MDKKDDKAVCRFEKTQWRGYSIDELEQRLAINQVKCDLIKEQLLVVSRSMTASFTQPGNRVLDLKVGKFMNYASYGLQLFKYVRGMMSLYKSFKMSLNR